MGASAGTDKNLRIWGMDFGDCRSCIIAHLDAITQVRFISNTHLCISSGKDRTIRLWDCDSFNPLFVVDAHLSEVWALAISYQGDIVLSGGHDRAIRRWERNTQTNELEVMYHHSESPNLSKTIVGR